LADAFLEKPLSFMIHTINARLYKPASSSHVMLVSWPNSSTWEYDERRTLPRRDSDNVLFAVRGGGQSPVPGGASAKGGVLIDLALFREVMVADDRESVALGAGVRWVDALRILDDQGLTTVGGRSSDVGVAGYTLGGEHTVPPFKAFSTD
jgi:hypothetical protein